MTDLYRNIGVFRNNLEDVAGLGPPLVSRCLRGRGSRLGLGLACLGQGVRSGELPGAVCSRGGPDCAGDRRPAVAAVGGAARRRVRTLRRRASSGLGNNDYRRRCAMRPRQSRRGHTRTRAGTRARHTPSHSPPQDRVMYSSCPIVHVPTFIVAQRLPLTHPVTSIRPTSTILSTRPSGGRNSVNTKRNRAFQSATGSGEALEYSQKVDNTKWSIMRV